MCMIKYTKVPLSVTITCGSVPEDEEEEEVEVVGGGVVSVVVKLLGDDDISIVLLLLLLALSYPLAAEVEISDIR